MEKEKKRKNPFTNPPKVQFDDEPLLTIYVIGPVTGMEGLNIEAFVRAKTQLEEAGYHAIIPHDIIDVESEWLNAIVTSLYAIERIDGIASLEGSTDSPGATIEAIAAMRIGRPIMSVEEWIARGAK